MRFGSSLWPSQTSAPSSAMIEHALILILEQVGRAGDALLQLIRAVIDQRQHEAVGVGVRPDLADRAQEQLVPIPDEMMRDRVANALDESLGQADVGNVADLQPGGGQALGQHLRRHVDVDEFLEPRNGDEHNDLPLITPFNRRGFKPSAIHS